MSTSQWGSVVTALAGLLRVQSGYRAPTDVTDGVTVYAGSQRRMASDLGDCIMIGESGTWDLSVATLAGTSRGINESGKVVCRVTTQTGELEPLIALTSAQAVLATVETTIRTNPTLGLSPSPLSLLIAYPPTSVALGWPEGTRGQTCEILFSITYRARI